MGDSREQVLRALIEAVPGRRWDELPDLYDAEAVVSQPFAQPEPLRLRGREEIVDHFRRAACLPLRMRAENIVVNELLDPELIVGEFDYVGENVETGAAFRVANIFLLRVRRGLIVESRDYCDHARFGAALGRN